MMKNKVIVESSVAGNGNIKSSGSKLSWIGMVTAW